MMAGQMVFGEINAPLEAFYIIGLKPSEYLANKNSSRD